MGGGIPVDWIKVMIMKLKMLQKNSGLRKSLICYLLCGVTLTVMAVYATLSMCVNWQKLICRANGISEDYREIGNGEFTMVSQNGLLRVIRVEGVKSLRPSDRRLWMLLKRIEFFCIPVYSAGAVFLVSVLYYNNKLKEPIFLLKTEMQAIRDSDMSFSCRYDSADEMGEICKSLDDMRKVVVKNRQDMWEMMEEQRQINAAFAHDLGTPLTVISGYVELLLSYYKDGKVSEAQLMDILGSMKQQISRVEAFSRTMKELQTFEQLEPKKKFHDAQELEAEIKNMAGGLFKEGRISIKVSAAGVMYYDADMLMEVLGNLLSNALRYAKAEIEIFAERNEGMLCIYVKDDGQGMTKEALSKADSPYYSDTMQVEGEHVHFGLGLTISKILCRKHGGGITLSNSISGGAIVCARFAVEKNMADR